MNIGPFLDEIKRLADMDFWAGRFVFSFEDVRVPVPVAIALLDAVRYRAGLMDFVDLTAAENKSGDSDSGADSAIAPKRTRSE